MSNPSAENCFPASLHLRIRSFEFLRLAVVFLLAIGTSRLWGQDARLPVLTSIAQIRRLNPEQANRGYPVHVRAVVTYFDDIDPNLFVQDATGGNWVRLAHGVTGLRAGQLIDLFGKTVQTDFAPDITDPHWTVLGMAPLPVPHRPTYEEMVSTSQDSLLVEVEGVVRSYAREANGRRFGLNLGLAGGNVRVITPEMPPSTANLLGARVRLRGVCGAELNPNGQAFGVMIDMAAWDDLKVLDPGPSDPFAVPAQKIGSVQRFQIGAGSTRVIRIRGTVTAWAGDRVYLSDDSGDLYVQERHGKPLHPGDVVDVIGFPGVVNQTPALLDGSVRVVSAGPPPKPLAVTVKQALTGSYDSGLVTIEAELTGVSRLGNETSMLLQQGATVFTATLHGSPRSKPARLLEGSLVRVTGICVIDWNDDSNAGIPLGFRIRLRSEDDIVILRSPPWLNMERALLVVTLLIAAIGGTLAWIAILRRRVRKQTEIIRKTLESTSEGIAVVDSRHTTITWNQKFVDMWRLSPEALATRSRPRMMKAVSSQVKDPENYLKRSLELEHNPAAESDDVIEFLDGRVFERHSEPLRVNGRIAGRIWCYRDVSDARHSEAEMRQARDAAEAGNRAKSEFLANMSHEIRTPMNGIVGMTELLAGTSLNTEQREFLRIVRSSAESLLTIINDILDFSKIEAGRLDLEHIEFSVRELVEDVMKSFALSAGQKGVELACAVHRTVPDKLRGDPTRLRQILDNLLGNALKFTEKGDVIAAIDLQHVQDGVARVNFSVADTGIGITPDKLDAIFEAFAQADATTTRKYGGTGLGLTISSRLVRLMGGNLAVESEAGQGSRFYFTLPLPIVAGTRQTPGTKPLDERLEGKPILLLEPHPAIRRILRELLEDWGMQVTTVESTAAVVEALQEVTRRGRSFSLMILDSETNDAALPVISGHPLPPAIRLMPAGRTPGSAAAGQGASSYITKPVRRSELREAILAALDRSPERAGPLPEEIPAGSKATAGAKHRILLAEDNAVNQKLAVSLLEKRGYAVTVAGNGREAVSAIARERFDLVLMDVQMPEMDGFEAAAAIRDREKITGKRMPILAMTAHAMKGDEQKCLDAGMDAYIAKPIRPDELYRLLAALVSAGSEEPQPTLTT